MDNRGSIIDAVCPRCAAMAVPGDRMITCKTCGLVFTPRDDVQAPSERALPDRGPPPDAPDGMYVERDGDTTRIVWPFDDVGEWMFVFVLLTAPFAIAAYFEPVDWAIGLAVGVGTVMAYFVFAHAVGGRVITIDRGSLTRHVRPVPTRPGARIVRAEIVSLEIRTTRDRGNKGAPMAQLWVCLRGNDERVLIEELAETEAERITQLKRVIDAALDV